MKKLFLFLLIPLLWFSCSPGDSGSSSGIEITLNKTSLTLVLEKTYKLEYTITGTSNKAITWSSSNESVAKVNGGTVTAVAEGNATITVTSKADTTKKAQCAVTVIQRPITDIGDKDGLSNLTVAEYFAQKNVFIGWNLGNAFDAGAGYGSWTKKIDKDFLPKIKEAGFSMVRIPVTWNVSTRPIGDAPDYTLNANTLNELVQVVDWAYEAGLVTIINVHHDGSQNGNNVNNGGWLSLLRLKQNETDRNAITAKFVKVWEQIADKFKDYGDWLIFEPFNELHNGGWGWGNIDNVEYEIINDLNQKFTNTVRAAGGKNTQRFLVVQPLCAKPHQAMANTFTLPTDSATGKQIVSMHYYDPEPFALRGENINWGTESDKIRLSGDFNNYANKFTKKGIPVILGECGATYQNISNLADKVIADANRFAYLTYMCNQAKENGIIPVYWDNGTIMASSKGENFGLWDRRSSGDLEVFPGMQTFIDTMILSVQ
jgi:endoglucanase